jgi:hypothetical protein
MGRATIEALQLNRVRVVNLRRVLLVTGDHPPADSTIAPNISRSRRKFCTTINNVEHLGLRR